MTHNSPLHEAQEYQSIGELAPEAEAVLTHQKAWDGLAGTPPRAEPPIDQLQAHDISFWNRRANRQALATASNQPAEPSSYAEDFFRPVNSPAGIPPVAGYRLGQGYSQTPTAATTVDPFGRSTEWPSDPGSPRPGGNAAGEQSGNRGTTP